MLNLNAHAQMPVYIRWPMLLVKDKLFGFQAR